MYDLINGSLEKGDDVRDLLLKNKEYLKKFNKFAPMICNVSRILINAYKNNQKILFEGAQGFGLDISHGQYPRVTSSDVGSTGISSGAGFPPKFIGKIIGVAKSYNTRVCIAAMI